MVGSLILDYNCTFVMLVNPPHGNYIRLGINIRPALGTEQLELKVNS
jgi:hypothetical protein